MNHRQRIAQSFSRAAPSYDSAARLQHDVAQALLATLTPTCPGVAVDIGCGTGFVARALAQRDYADVIALDIAEGMLVHTRDGFPSLRVLQADMHQLPIAGGSAALLVSSLALQWASDPARCFREWRRVLDTGGSLHFTTLLPGTLHELATSWQTIDSAVHVNRFNPAGEITAALQATGFSRIESRQETHCLHYPTVEALARDLKAIGAHNMNPGQPAGLTGRRRWQQLQAAYDNWRTPQGLPATYEVLHVRAA